MPHHRWSQRDVLPAACVPSRGSQITGGESETPSRAVALCSTRGAARPGHSGVSVEGRSCGWGPTEGRPSRRLDACELPADGRQPAARRASPREASASCRFYSLPEMRSEFKLCVGELHVLGGPQEPAPPRQRTGDL